MVSSLPRHFQFGVLARALLLAALIVILIRLMTTTQFYATELVVLLIGLLVVADLVRVVAYADRQTQRFLESLTSGDPDHPPPAYDRAWQSLQQDRRMQRQGSDYLQTLLDTVPAALLVVDADGALRMVNRAAYRLLGEPAPR